MPKFLQKQQIWTDPKKQFNYFVPEKHKELQKRKEDWMKEGDEWKIDFEKLEKMDEFKNKYPKKEKENCIWMI